MKKYLHIGKEYIKQLEKDEQVKVFTYRLFLKIKQDVSL